MNRLEKLRKEIEEEMEKEKVPEDERTTQFINIFTGNLDFYYEIEDK